MLDMFDTAAVLPLRATCRDAVAAVAAHPWDDLETVICGNVGPALLPAGRPASRTQLSCPLRASSLEMSYCTHATITDAAFVPLAGIQSLTMHGCTQATIHRRCLCAPGGNQVTQATITDAAFASLAGIQRLNMLSCREAIIASARAAGLRVVCWIFYALCARQCALWQGAPQ